MARSLAPAVLLASLAVALAQTAPNKQPDPLQQCVLSKEKAQKIDYSPIKTACAVSTPVPARCEPCLCAFNDVFGKALREEGVQVNIATAKPEDVQTALGNCLDTVLDPLTAAGVDLAALGDLTNCPQTIPACFNAAG